MHAFIVVICIQMLNPILIFLTPDFYNFEDHGLVSLSQEIFFRPPLQFIQKLIYRYKHIVIKGLALNHSPVLW